jgi:hypothetical protein
VALKVGDAIDFAIDPDGAGNLATLGIDGIQDGCDGTSAGAVISRFFTGGGPTRPQFRRGDADAKGGVPNITDGIFVLNYLFLGGPEPSCKEAADADNKGGINITDGIYILNYLFQGGPAPPSPGPDACGFDTDEPGTAGDVGCETYNPDGC